MLTNPFIAVLSVHCIGIIFIRLIISIGYSWLLDCESGGGGIEKEGKTTYLNQLGRDVRSGMT